MNVELQSYPTFASVNGRGILYAEQLNYESIRFENYEFVCLIADKVEQREHIRTRLELIL